MDRSEKVKGSRATSSGLADRLGPDALLTRSDRGDLDVGVGRGQAFKIVLVRRDHDPAAGFDRYGNSVGVSQIL